MVRRGRLFNITSATSLLLLATTVVIWCGSYLSDTSVRYSTASFQCACVLDKGICQIEWVNGDMRERGIAWNDYRREGAWGREELEMFGPMYHPMLTKLGFGGWDVTEYIPGAGLFGPKLPARETFFPLWFVTLLAAIPPAIWIAIVRRCEAKTAVRPATTT